MTYLITGGTGFLGRALVDALLPLESTARIIVLSRGEHRQAEFQSAIADPKLECWIKDVRDRDEMRWAMRARPDVVLHCAALKRVEKCEQNPAAAFKTNVDGTRNVVEEAMLAGVPRVIVVSSDKATSPETTYGKTKAAAEEIALGQNAYRGGGPTRISVVRYGNVLGSTGSFLDVLWRARHTGDPLAITDRDSTRFWWSVDDAVAFIRRALSDMRGAEIFVPKLISARVIDLARAVAPESALTITGMRGSEKRHETMINVTEALYAYELPDYYVLLPKQGQWWSPNPPLGAVKVPDGFSYSSDQDPLAVSVEAVCG